MAISAFLTGVTVTFKNANRTCRLTYFLDYQTISAAAAAGSWPTLTPAAHLSGCCQSSKGQFPLSPVRKEDKSLYQCFYVTAKVGLKVMTAVVLKELE